ncbi:MAG: membrane dipeptidase [Clostridia bacterium]|nr:membrane dipeptidase [Clostridia bacterium]
MLPLFDLHCDTLTASYEGNYSLLSSPLHISLDKCVKFSPYFQIMAIWTNDALSSEAGFKRYKKTLEYAKNQGFEFSTKLKNNKENMFFLAIEDLRIIGNDLSRIDILYQDGVRFITPVWKDISQIGGAWNTKLGISRFGKRALEGAIKMGITIDVSHCSECGFYDILELCYNANAIPVATHSCSYSICAHKRNLTDEQFLNLVRLGSCVGISLAPEHLSSNGIASIDDILRHIDHYLSLGGENNISLGCDFDGVSSLPMEISSIFDLDKLYYRLLKCYDEAITNKIFCHNFLDLSKRILN